MFHESVQQEDSQLSSSSPPGMAQVTHQEHESCQHSAKFNPSENEDVIQFPQIPPRLQKQELAEVSTEVPHRQAGARPGGGARWECTENYYLL